MGNQGKTAGIQSCYSKIKLNSLPKLLNLRLTFEVNSKIQLAEFFEFQKVSERSTFQIMARSSLPYLTFLKKCFVVVF